MPVNAIIMLLMLPPRRHFSPRAAITLFFRHLLLLPLLLFAFHAGLPPFRCRFFFFSYVIE